MDKFRPQKNLEQGETDQGRKKNRNGRNGGRCIGFDIDFELVQVFSGGRGDGRHIRQ